jgi:hypothetical protein
MTLISGALTAGALIVGALKAIALKAGFDCMYPRKLMDILFANDTSTP